MADRSPEAHRLATKKARLDRRRRRWSAAYRAGVRKMFLAALRG